MSQELLLLLFLCAALCLGDIEVSIDEEVSPGTEVTRLPSHRSVYGNLTDDQILAMNYAILSQNSPPASFFKIDSSTGVVTVASRMDREEICDPTEKCSVKVNIAVQAGGQGHVSFSTVVTLDVELRDVNDNPPRFPARDVTLDIPEGSKVKTELKVSGAVDLDSRSEFKVQHYNITPSLNTFSLRPVINLDGSSTINLRLERELDRETTDEYRFNIMAYDGGSSPQSDYMTVTIRVTDDNDNIPKFGQSRYDMTVNTNQPIGAQIGQVLATDEDIGDFGRITYNFSSSSESVIKGVFAINSSTGWITLAGDLRTIRRSSPFQIFVYARDNGEPPLSSQALVSVLIISSENNAPFVKVSTVAAGDVSTLAIPESATLDHFMAFVYIDDNDEGDNGKVACQITTGSDFKLSSVPNKGYTLLLNREVDREKKDYYQIVISCRDGGTPPLETTVTLPVNITDINDNTPKFSSNLYTGIVDENRDAGQFIAQVTAQDADFAVNAEITYSLPKEAHEYIRIHPKTGVISTSNPLDRERNSTLRFNVFATDGGEKPRSGVAEVYVVVKDINDNPPYFNQSKFVFSVSEQIANNSIVAVLQAYDLDTDSNGQFDFYFGGSTNGEVPLPFAVLKNGSIQVTGSLDRETKGNYSFTALVRDRGDVPLSNTVSVEVKVLDENDNDPVILFPTSKNHTIIISSLPENGMVLGRIIAYDMDERDAAELRYFIYEGNADGAFSMGVHNGELIVQNVGRLHNHKEYFLSIKVEDSSVRPRNTTTRLRIEVVFDNATGVGSLQQGENSRDQYIIIVGVIGGATIIFSVIIISAIILILRSERNRRGVSSVQPVKNKLFDAASTNNASVHKQGDNLDTTKSPSSSSPGHDLHGMASAPGSLCKKGDDVPKKVSFSIQDEPRDHCQVELPDKQLRLNLPSVDATVPWRKFTNPDDISSDTSGESGTGDSGRGTSDEDIKFEYLLNRGTSRQGEPYLSARDRSFDQFSMANPTNTWGATTNYQGQGSPRLHTSTPLLQPSRFLETDQGHMEVLNTRSSFYGQRQNQHSSFVPGAPSSSRHPHHQRPHNFYTENIASPAPMAYNQLSLTVSMDDDVSTTTSGSYVINPEDVRLEGFMNKDVVV